MIVCATVSDAGNCIPTTTTYADGRVEKTHPVLESVFKFMYTRPDGTEGGRFIMGHEDKGRYIDYLISMNYSFSFKTIARSADD